MTTYAHKEAENIYTHIGNILENADKIVQGWNPIASSMRRCGRGLISISFARIHASLLPFLFSCGSCASMW